MDKRGEFRISAASDGLCLVIYGPRDLKEAKEGVPQAAFALWPDKIVFSADTFGEFLNAALEASHGRPERLNDLCSPKASEALNGSP